MAITEFVHLSIPSPYDSNHPTLLAAITKCTTIMRASSGLPSIFFADLNDNSKMYVLGGWPSQDAHQHGFNGSPEQAELIKGIKGMMDITWMEYLGLEMSEGESVKGKGLGGDGGGEVEIDLRAKDKCFGAVVVDAGNLDARTDASTKKTALEKQIAETVEQLDKGKGTDIIKVWNLKKREKDSENDFVVLLMTFDNSDDAYSWELEVANEIYNMSGVSVETKYFKKAEYQE